MHLHESVFEAPQPSQELMGPSSRSLPAAGLALLLLALACAPQTRPPVWADQAGLVEVESHGPGRLFVNHEHELGRYDELYLYNVGFHYRDGQPKLGEADEDRIMAMLVSAIEGGKDGAIGVATHPGPCVLAVDFYIKDLELADRTDWKGSISEFRRSLGSATMILELRDSQSNEPIARFIERRSLSGGWWLGQWDEQLDRLDRAITLAVSDMGTQLWRITSPYNAALDDRCEGTLTKVALGSH